MVAVVSDPGPGSPAPHPPCGKTIGYLGWLNKQKPLNHSIQGLKIKILAVSYSHMGRPHTTIGAERFHFRVRNGIGWFPLAKTTRQTSIAFSNLKISDIVCVAHIHVTCHITKVFWCYMAKPHEQLVLVSFIHY